MLDAFSLSILNYFSQSAFGHPVYITVWLLELFNKKKMGFFQILQDVLTVKYTLVLDIIRIRVQILGTKKKEGFFRLDTGF